VCVRAGRFLCVLTNSKLFHCFDMEDFNFLDPLTDVSKFVPAHAMKVYWGSGSIVTLIRSLDTCTPRSLYSWA
jgi:hypothetical protein